MLLKIPKVREFAIESLIEKKEAKQADAVRVWKPLKYFTSSKIKRAQQLNGIFMLH